MEKKARKSRTPLRSGPGSVVVWRASTRPARTLAAMDQELIAYLDERFRESLQHNDSLHQETARQYADLHQEIARQYADLRQEIRHTQITVEGLRDDNQMVAEGVSSLEERLQSFHNEFSLKLDEVQSSITPYYRDLDRRVSLLEERAKREGQAPLDYIRERYGKTARPSD